MSAFPLLRTKRCVLNEITTSSASYLVSIHDSLKEQLDIWGTRNPLLRLDDALQAINTMQSERERGQSIRWGIYVVKSDNLVDSEKSDENTPEDLLV